MKPTTTVFVNGLLFAPLADWYFRVAEVHDVYSETIESEQLDSPSNAFEMIKEVF